MIHLTSKCSPFWTDDFNCVTENMILFSETEQTQSRTSRFLTAQFRCREKFSSNQHRNWAVRKWNIRSSESTGITDKVVPFPGPFTFIAVHLREFFSDLPWISQIFDLWAYFCNCPENCECPEIWRYWLDAQWDDRNCCDKEHHIFATQNIFSNIQNFRPMKIINGD